MFSPSHYQTDIFNWISDGSGSAQVGAVAGSGKTTTLVEAASLLQGDSVFVAFNKHIAETLKARLGRRCSARTLHSIGLEAITDAFGRMKVDGRKYRRFYEDARGSLKPEEYTSLPKLVDFARLTLGTADEAALAQTADDFGIYYTSRMGERALEALAWGVERMKQGDIDFSDMVWIPAELRLSPSASYDMVLADEAQDFNVAQRKLVLSLLKPGARLLAVGDENQAIMQFAGADRRSWKAIAQETDARLLPLSICYRCPTSHIKLAQELVPQIEARDGAPQGVVETIRRDALGAMVRTGDLILCRRTAPLIPQCFRFIANGINARVRGRDIGKGIAETVRRIAKTPAAFGNFAVQVEKWLDGEVARIAQRNGSEDAILQAQDKAECMLICKANFTAYSGAELATRIEDIFSDDQAPITLSTIHRAKGLEADRVFILEADRLGFARKPEDAEAERNLHYVAITRSKSELYFIESERIR